MIQGINTMLTFLKYFLFIILILILFLYGYLYYIQEKLIFLPDKLEADHKFYFSHSFKEIDIDVGDASIHGLHFRKKNPKGVVLYFHGNAGSLDSWGSVSNIFTRQNYDAIIIDYRGYGKSTGKINSEKYKLIGKNGIITVFPRKFKILRKI